MRIGEKALAVEFLLSELAVGIGFISLPAPQISSMQAQAGSINPLMPTTGLFKQIFPNPTVFVTPMLAFGVLGLLAMTNDNVSRIAAALGALLLTSLWLMPAEKGNITSSPGAQLALGIETAINNSRNQTMGSVILTHSPNQGG